jgi:hypothetical protein
MPTIYYGVFCANCGKFIQIGTYDGEALGANLRDVTPGTGKLQCLNCEAKWLYQRADVAHSLSPDGKQPYYPQR